MSSSSGTATTPETVSSLRTLSSSAAAESSLSHRSLIRRRYLCNRIRTRHHIVGVCRRLRHGSRGRGRRTFKHDLGNLIRERRRHRDPRGGRSRCTARGRSGRGTRASPKSSCRIFEVQCISGIAIIPPTFKLRGRLGALIGSA